jgi:hypothetical protein
VHRPAHGAIHGLLLPGRTEPVVNKGKIELIVWNLRVGAISLDRFDAKIVLEKGAQFLDLGDFQLKDAEQRPRDDSAQGSEGGSLVPEYPYCRVRQSILRKQLVAVLVGDELMKLSEERVVLIHGIDELLVLPLLK